MANRPKGFGMTAELNRKKEGKFDVGLANECFEWMRQVLQNGGLDKEAATLGVSDPKSFKRSVPLQTDWKNHLLRRF